MAMIKTDLGETRERARELRFEPTGSITATNVQKAIEQVGSSPPVSPSTDVSAGLSPYTVLATDYELYVDSSAGPVQILLQPAAARGGSPLLIKDVGGAAGNPAKNITITPNGAETVDGIAPLLIDSNFGGYNLKPRTGRYTIRP